MLTVDYDRLDLRPGMTVLDLGCGEGRHAFEAYRRGATVLAVPVVALFLFFQRQFVESSIGSSVKG